MIRYHRKNWNTVWQHISYLHTLRKPVIWLGGSFCIIFSAITLLVSFNKMYFNEPYSRVQTGKRFSDAFPVPNGLQQEDTSSPLLLSSALECALEGFRKTKLNSCHITLVCTDDENLLGKKRNIYYKEKHISFITC